MSVVSTIADTLQPGQYLATNAAVTNTAIAVTPINNYDGLVFQSQAKQVRFRHGYSEIGGISPYYHTPSRMNAAMSVIGNALHPRATGGRVENGNITVTSVSNTDGRLIDYYNQYEGNGATKAGWSKMESWILFANMYFVLTPLPSSSHNLQTPPRFNSSKWFMERSCRQFQVSLNT